MQIVFTGNTSFKIANFRAGLVRALISGGHSVTVLAPPDEYTETLIDMGCQFVPLYMDRNGTNPISETRLLLSVHRSLRRIRPDFVFSYTIKNNIYSGLVCRMLGIPFAPNVTGLGPAFCRGGILTSLVRNLYRVAFRKASKVFFQNEQDQAVFLDAKIVHQNSTKLLPGSGVDLTAFSQAPLPDVEQPVRFLLVARMLKNKGVIMFAEAARVVKDKHPEVKFQLLGPIDAESRTAIRKSEIDAWVTAGVVDYLGSQTDVRPTLRQAHCVVLPSYYYEGTPRSLLEAAAIGRPLISTEMPGCRDAVLPGVSGFLVAPRQIDQLAQAMQDFINLPANERIAMGQASRRHMEEKYNEQIIINAYFDLVTHEI